MYYRRKKLAQLQVKQLKEEAKLAKIANDANLKSIAEEIQLQKVERKQVEEEARVIAKVVRIAGKKRIEEEKQLVKLDVIRWKVKKHLAEFKKRLVRRTWQPRLLKG